MDYHVAGGDLCAWLAAQFGLLQDDDDRLTQVLAWGEAHGYTESTFYPDGHVQFLRG